MPQERFTTPVGRFVQGDAFVAQDKDMQGNPRVIKSGPNMGQLNPQFFMAVAFSKQDPAFNDFWAQLRRIAAADFPALFPQGPNGPCVNPNFAFKVVDGDGVDTRGTSNAGKQGFAGCWIVRFASSFAPKVFNAGHYAPAEQVVDPKQLRKGYYVRINGSAQGNGDNLKPGLYVNLDLVEIAGYGEEIVTGPSAADAFGAAPAVLPPGASATPMLAAPAAPMAPGMVPAAAPGLPGAPAAPGVPPAPGVPAVPPAAGVAPSPAAASYAPANPAAPGVPGAAPNYSYLAAPGAPGGPPAAPGVPAAPAAPPAPAAPAAYNPQDYMTATATASYAAYREAGWSDAQLIAAGHMRDHVPH